MSVQIRGSMPLGQRGVSETPTPNSQSRPNSSSTLPGGIDRFLFPQRIFEFLRDVRREGFVQALFRPDSDENSNPTPSPAALAGALAGGSLVLGAVLDPELFERTKSLVLSDDPQNLRQLKNHYNSTGDPRTLTMLAAIATSREATPDKVAEILFFCWGAFNDRGYPEDGIHASMPWPNDFFEGLDLSFLRAQVETNRDVFLTVVRGNDTWTLASHSAALEGMLREANFQSFGEQAYDLTIASELLRIAQLYHNESAREILRNLDTERFIQANRESRGLFRRYQLMEVLFYRLETLKIESDRALLQNLDLGEILQFIDQWETYINREDLKRMASIGNFEAQRLLIIHAPRLREGAGAEYDLEGTGRYLDGILRGERWNVVLPGFEDWAALPESERLPLLREALSEWHGLSSTERVPFMQERGFLTFLESRLPTGSQGSLVRPAIEDLRREDDPTRGLGRGRRGR